MTLTIVLTRYLITKTAPISQYPTPFPSQNDKKMNLVIFIMPHPHCAKPSPKHTCVTSLGRHPIIFPVVIQYNTYHMTCVWRQGLQFPRRFQTGSTNKPWRSSLKILVLCVCCLLCNCARVRVWQPTREKSVHQVYAM